MEGKLLDRVRQAIRVRHCSRRTEEAYVTWIRRFIVFHDKKHASTLGAAQECLELRVKDMDFDGHQIVVRRGKGRKDRRTMLPGIVRERLIAHLAGVRRQHEQDLADGEGRVVLPGALERKYPRVATDWAWQFVFPAARICRDPHHRRGSTCMSRPYSGL